VGTVLAQLDDNRSASAYAVTSLLAVAIVLGSAALWIGIPFGGLWLAGELTTTAQGFLFATLGGIPLAMTAFAWLLYRVNGLYERSRGAEDAGGRRRSAWLVSSTDERSRVRRARAPRALIDVAMTLSATAALVLMAIWFFFFSEMWLVNPL
jgi:asparagine N-glycosylation enzyme membrane subunit Stt3